jgi:hypothetical protein
MSARYFLLLTLILLFSTSALSHTSSFPKYHEVVKHFFDTHSLDSLYDKELFFQKKPDGWFVFFIMDQQDYLLPIWDAVSGHYADSLLVVDTSAAYEKIKKKHLESWEVIHYDACPYYGYNQWYIDAIRDFGDYEGDDTDLVYGMGRAYSNYAVNLLSDQYGIADSSLLFGLGYDKMMNADQLAEYRKFRHKAIDCFVKTARLNPSYQTLVGRIDHKRDMEYVATFVDLAMFSTMDEARKELPDNLFSDFYLEYARNLLASCEKNGILFTYGDTDTYLPIYVQQSQGYRTDVTVIHVGFLAHSRYCLYLEKYERIHFTLEAATKGDKQLAFAYLPKESPDGKTRNVSELIHFLNDPGNLMENQGYTFATLPTNYFQMVRRDRFVTWRSEEEYIFKHHLLVLDIVNAELSSRPIYFTNSSGKENLEGFTKNIQKDLMTYPVVNDFVTVGEYYLNTNSGKNYHLAMNVLHWENASKAVSGEKMITVNYRIALALLAETLANENKRDSARQVIDLILKHFGNENMAYDYFMLAVIRACYKIQDYSRGNLIARQIVYNFRHDIEVLDANVIRGKAAKYEPLENEVRDILRKFNQDEMILDE